jgi:hypothetical protein
MPGGEGVIQPLRRLGRADAAALTEHAADVARFLAAT